MNSNRPMDWDWIKAFPQTLKDEFKSMKITVNWEKAWPAVFIAFLAGLPLLLIAGLIHWRLGWLKAYQQNWLPLWVPCVTTASSTHQKRSLST
ncbi:hypothetical protein MUTS16_27900 [Escherichia coli]|nr:hypothetical protein MUTS16_27900 [Escherichia coli]